MATKYITILERSYIKNQAITYFGLSLLLMGSIGKDLKLVKPSIVDINIWPLPFSIPSLDVGSWPMLVIDLSILALSLFFLATLFSHRWARWAMRISRLLNFGMIVLIPLTFFIGAARGLINIAEVPFPWYVVFTWGTIILMLVLEVYSFIELFHYKIPTLKSTPKVERVLQ
jgi:hypothetical protein